VISRERIATFVAFAFLLLTCAPSNTAYAIAPAATVYESMSGTVGTQLDAVAGSGDSVGFFGNWVRVASQKQGADPGLPIVETNTYNAKIAYPANSRFTIQGNNTYASTTNGLYHLYYSARPLTNAINFDTNGTFYLSFLSASPLGNGYSSAMVGLLSGLPSNNTDTSKNGIFFGITYSNLLTIVPTTANIAVWNAGGYTYTDTSTGSNANGKTWFVIVKITTAASGNDTVQAKAYAPTDSLPVSDSSITWGTTYSAAITGSWGYLSAQTEDDGIVDELRGGSTYESVAGAPTTPTIGSPTVVGIPNKGISTNLTVTVGAAGYFRFYIDGKRIPACLKVVATGTSPNFTATCIWKPPVRGLHSVYATYTSTDITALNTTTPTASIQVISRTNNR